MHISRFSFPRRLFVNCLLAILTVAAATLPLYLIGRATLGEGVIALLYLLPVTWSASRWGLWPGISAAVAATLCFDFLFIPPFFTFTVGSLEGWLILGIFLGVAIFVVERLQVSLSKARAVVWMYELSIALSGQRTQEAIIHSVAQQVQQWFQAALVNVIFQSGNLSPKIAASYPEYERADGKPDRILPIVNTWGFVGEIQIWRGAQIEIPPTDDPLLQNVAWQTGRALERSRALDIEREATNLASKPLPK